LIKTKLKKALTELLLAEPTAVAPKQFFSGISTGYAKSYEIAPLFSVDIASTRKIPSGP
jgi:hypothetical protein